MVPIQKPHESMGPSTTHNHTRHLRQEPGLLLPDELRRNQIHKLLNVEDTIRILRSSSHERTSIRLRDYVRTNMGRDDESNLAHISR